MTKVINNQKDRVADAKVRALQVWISSQTDAFFSLSQQFISKSLELSKVYHIIILFRNTLDLSNGTHDVMAQIFPISQRVAPPNATSATPTPINKDLAT